MPAQVFRQKDQDFVDLLQELRVGRCSERNEARLKQCAHNELKAVDGVLPTKLYTHRHDTQQENQAQLAKLPGQTVWFRAQDFGETDLLNKSPCEADLYVKIGAQVRSLFCFRVHLAYFRAHRSFCCPISTYLLVSATARVVSL